MLRKILATLLVVTALGSCAIAGAAPRHWQLWGDKGEGKLYFDINTLHRTNDLLTVQEKEEKSKADAKGIKGEILSREYNVKKKQYRTIGKQLYNAQGKTLVTNKKIEPWQTVSPQSTLAAKMEFLLASSRLQGPWEQVKTIGNTAVKFYNPSTLKEVKNNVLEVWEKLELNKITNQTKTIVTFVSYNVAKETATTLYTCNYNAQGELLSAKSDIDNWGVAGDSYGEYIGNELKAKLHKKTK